MELRHLRYFVSVAEELHFGRAASRLGISQPPLSQQIRLLEDEVGVRLFDRTSRRVQLTDAGRLFLVEARLTLDHAERAIVMARRAQAGEAGELAIAFTTSVPFVPAVARTLFAFREGYPEVQLDILEMSRDAQIAALSERRIDLGFIRDAERPVLPPRVKAKRLLEEGLLVAMRVDHRLAAETTPLHIADLEGEPLVIYEPHLGAGFNERLSEIFRNAGVELNVVQEVSGVATLLGLVAAGFGMTVLTHSLSALHPDNIVYRVLDEPTAVSRLWLVHRDDTSATGRRFAAMLDAQTLTG